MDKMKEEAIIMSVLTGIPVNECFRILDRKSSQKDQKNKKNKKD